MSDPTTVSNAYYSDDRLKSSISRIEIWKGNQSSVYGSGAMGGTVNITTKKGKEGFQKEFNLISDSNDTINFSGSFAGADEKKDFWLGYENYYTEGNSAMTDNDEKDALINRFRKGYDNEITKKFAYRLLKLKNIIEELTLEPNLKKEDMENLNESLSDILDENDIESFAPNLGEDYRKLGDLVSDKVDFQTTNNENDNFKITEILKKGYRFKGGNNEIILPAEVKINKFN